jgi:hypothetical protein
MDPDPGGPKICGFGFPTLKITYILILLTLKKPVEQLSC